MALNFTWQLITPAPAAPFGDVEGVVSAFGGTTLRDLKLDLSARRMVMESGSFVFTRGPYAVLQDVWLALGFFEGEWFLDLERGVPYFRKILVKTPNMDEIRAVYRDAILGRPGVRDLLALELAFNRTARTLAVSFRINTDVGELASASTFTVG